MDGVYCFALMVIGLGVFVASEGLSKLFFDYLEINEYRRFPQRFIFQELLGVGLTVVVLVLLSCLLAG